jgi:hypothetical protein
MTSCPGLGECQGVVRSHMVEDERWDDDCGEQGLIELVPRNQSRSLLYTCKTREKSSSDSIAVIKLI